MRVYLDSSALVKRVLAEPESGAVVETIDDHVTAGALLVSSSLAWIEVTRVLRIRFAADRTRVAPAVEGAMGGVAEHPLSPEVVSLARRVDPDALRSLDAVHLATALLVDADRVLTYDARLAAACVDNGLAVERPA